MRIYSVRDGLITIPARWLLVGTVVAGTALTASPAHAEVTFDFAAHTGFADATTLRQAFGWDAPALRKNAAGVAFTRDTVVHDLYAVDCGPAGAPPVSAVHTREFGTWFLTMTVDRAPGGDVRGLRITGADAGISGTTVAPGPGLPCPGTADDPSRSTVLKPATAPKPGTTVTPGAGPGPAAVAEPGTAPGAAPAPGVIRTATLLSTTTTMTLIAKHGGTARELVELREGPEIPA